MERECQSCLESGLHVPAIGNCHNPDYAGYSLCAECIAEFDSRPHGVIEAGQFRLEHTKRNGGMR